MQWPLGVVWGAVSWTPPRLCSSSWASIDSLCPQQPLSTRAIMPDTLGSPLLSLAPGVVDWLSSVYISAMPQYTSASVNTRYLRSLRV